MALIFCDGFDHYSTDEMDHKWDYRGGTIYPTTPSIVEGAGRFGTHGLQMTDTWCRAMKALPFGPRGYLTAGVAVRPSNAPADNIYVISFVSGTQFLLSVGISPTMQVFLQSGAYGGPVIAYAGKPARNGLFNYIEMQVSVFSSGSGVVKVWLNEVLVMDLNGVRTTSGGYSSAEAVMLGGDSSWQRHDVASFYFDDFYVTDHNGTDNTDNLGDVRVIEQLPISDHDKEWTRSGGDDNYALVDDAWDGIDDDATYVTTTAHDAKDTYGFPELPTEVGDVKAVAMNFWANKMDSGSRGVSMTADLGNVYGDGNEERVGGDYANHQSIMERDPNDALWTIANVNAGHFGPKLTT